MFGGTPRAFQGFQGYRWEPLIWTLKHWVFVFLPAYHKVETLTPSYCMIYYQALYTVFSYEQIHFTLELTIRGQQ